MVKRQIIEIDEELCNGCGLCIPNCPEGALQIIDSKARLISDLFCDGLGACIGHCPKGAIQTIEREAIKYDEKKTMENIVKKGSNTIKAHLIHLKEHGENKLLQEALEFLKEKNIRNPLDNMETKKSSGCSGGCPGSQMQVFEDSVEENPNIEQKSQLKQWPVQLNLLPVQAPFYENKHLLIAADCVPFSYANFHSKLLVGKTLLIGCPKLDDTDHYKEKLVEIFKNNNIKSITVAIMEVPCCSGLHYLVDSAIKESGKNVPLVKEVVSIKGELY